MAWLSVSGLHCAEGGSQRRSDMRARITTSSVHLAWTLSRDRNDINALNL